jgi:hypothetical protein
MKRFLAASLALIPLAACSWNQPEITEENDTSIETQRPETKNVIYRGTLLPLGSSIYMEGTHRLQLEDGRFVLLESNGLVLDDYLGQDVEVFGSTRATIEGSAIIMRVERVANATQSNAEESSSSTSSSSSSEVTASSVAVQAPISSATVLASSRPPVLVLSSAAASVATSSIAPVAPASSVPTATASSASSVDPALEARVTAMAKANMDPANWTQEYCSPTHLGFCFPIHKNWWFTSFGATSSSVWHVEMSSEELAKLGDGPISVVLQSGNATAPDGLVVTEGAVTTGVRAWSGNRHFVISAPARLEAAVRYITQELHAAPTASGASSQ